MPKDVFFVYNSLRVSYEDIKDVKGERRGKLKWGLV